MKLGHMRASEATGFFPAHAKKFEEVANISNCIILFREPGKMAAGLIAENYAMKGFRIDTKSCNWGPMAGFVCADPRFTKDQKYATDTVKPDGTIKEANPTWTGHALSGHVKPEFFGDVHDRDWVADVMPIVISKKRIDYLTSTGTIRPTMDRRGAGAIDYVGVSNPPGGKLDFHWRLLDATNAAAPWMKNGADAAGHYHVLCIDKGSFPSFQQIYPRGVEPILFRGFQTVLGLTNPGSKSRGFKACVTADYDLFAIWEKSNPANDPIGAVHGINQGILNHPRFAQSPATQAQRAHILAGANGAPGVARLPGADDRLQAQGHREHYKYGDVSARIMKVKAMLNSALIGSGAYTGGNAVHHNDEQGNMALAKGSLQECLPVIGFIPGKGTVLVETSFDFKQLIAEARNLSFNVRVKDSWIS